MTEINIHTEVFSNFCCVFHSIKYSGKKKIPCGPQKVEVIKNEIAERICIILVRNRFPDASQIFTVCGVAFLNSKTEDRQTR